MPRIFHTDQGSGSVVVLIHGFPLTGQIWERVASSLASKHRVITIDLPGFGKSEMPGTDFTIDDIGKQVVALLKSLEIKSCTLVGHSLGGYVALAMINKSTELFSKLILFHSTPHADTEEKKQNRNKVLEFIERNGVVAFTGAFVPPLFADAANKEIDNIRKLAVASSKEAVIGYTKAMRDRPERIAVLQEFHRPVLIVAGEKDSVIPVEALKKLEDVSPTISVKVLAESGHMAMVEKPAESAIIIGDFVRPSNQP
jgi:pimeloyl-ACP methyl ester carboxylesterase